MSEKNTRLFFSISFILILALVPVLQALPSNLQMLPTASATSGIGTIVINNVKNTSATVTALSPSATLANFNAGTGNSRLLVVAVEADNKSVNSITFNGSGVTQSLSKVSGSFQNDYTAFWYLPNPVGTGAVTVTMAGASQVIFGAYALSGVDQANPIPTTATNFTNDNSPTNPSPTISLTTEYPNSMVLDSAALFGGSKLTGTGCGILDWSKQIASKVTGASSNTTRVLAGPVTCKWTNSVVQNGWDDTAIEIKAIGSSAQISPITLNGKSTASGFVPVASSSVTLYNFSAGNGANRLLVVGVAADTQSVKVNGIKFGSTALTKSISSFRNNDAELWYLKNPSNIPANLVVTMAGGTGHLSQFVVGAYAFSGVNQTSPISNSTSKNNTAVSSPSITITTKNANDWVVDQPSIYGGATLSSPTCLQQWNSNVKYNSTNSITGASSSELVPTTGSVTCSWTASAAEFWDDVAIDIHAVSLQASTGILEPLYDGPYNNTNHDGTPCSHAYCFAWDPVNTTKLQHPNVPVYAIVNPNSGPCFTGSGITCAYNRDFSNGIGNLTRDGVIVLGYTFTGNANPHWDDSRHCCPYTTPYGNVTQWATMYGPQNATFASKGVKGIFFDQMNNVLGANSETLDYYQNLTQYAKSLGFTYTIGNPGTSTISSYVNSGAANNVVINETNSTDAGGYPTISQLQSDTFSTSTNDLGYDKHDFSFLVYAQCSLPSTTIIDNQTNFAGLLYYTDQGYFHMGDSAHSCTNAKFADPWGLPASYLSALTAKIDNKTSVITINSTGPSAVPVAGLFVQISQKGNLIPSGYTPYSYLGTQGVTYTVTPQNSTACTFDHWKDTGLGPAARNITVGSTSKAYTVVYSGSSCK